MMTHVFENKEGKRLLLQRRSRNDYKVSNLSTEEQQQIQDTLAY
jgi:hypothetical protein